MRVCVCVGARLFSQCVSEQLLVFLVEEIESENVTGDSGKYGEESGERGRGGELKIEES